MTDAERAAARTALHAIRRRPTRKDCAMSDAERAEFLAEWHLGSMNDGLFIIDVPPRPSTDEVHNDRKDGPTLVLNVTDLPYEKAKSIVDAHNRALRLLAEQSAPSPSPADLREVVAKQIDPAAFIENPMMVMQPRRAQTDALKTADAALSAISAAGYVILPHEPTEAMVEAGATAKLNHERAVAGLMPVTLSDLEADDADLYRMEASIVLSAALAAKDTTP